MIRRWLRRRAAQRALKGAHRRAIGRAIDFALQESRRQARIQSDIRAGFISATPEILADAQAGNRETDRLIAVYRRIERRMNEARPPRARTRTKTVKSFTFDTGLMIVMFVMLSDDSVPLWLRAPAIAVWTWTTVGLILDLRREGDDT